MRAGAHESRFDRSLMGTYLRVRDALIVIDVLSRWDSDANRLIRSARGGKGGVIARKLAPRPGDAFLLKRRYSIFDHTSFELLLADLEVERLVLMGATTEGCVLQSGIDGRENGFKVTILGDACATIDSRLEEVALLYAAEVGGMRVERFVGEDPSNRDGEAHP
jgi:hypothetical protein